jgi:hypothetical protein
MYAQRSYSQCIDLLEAFGAGDVLCPFNEFVAAFRKVMAS